MNAPVPITLAFDWGELIGIGIILLVTFGSAVGSWLKKQAEAREAARRQERGLMSPHTLDEEGNPPARTDRVATMGDAASQRREQLRELARQRAQMHVGGQRGGAAVGGGRGPAGQPQNLTMAERIARARAQEEYARRADDLQAQAERARREAQVQQAQDEAVRRQRQAAREKMQREAAARQRAAQQQRARAQQQQQQASARPRRSQTQRPAAPIRQVGQAAAGGATAMPSAEARRRQQAKPSAARRSSRRVTAAAPAEASLVAGPSPLNLASMARQSLRDAFVLKEILDRPVGMREPGEHGLL